MRGATLIVFAGLPGVGKTTLSRAVATKLAATYLRVDAIEQAIRNAGVLAGDVGPAGYGVANAVAEANLAGGRTVVADCVNPVIESHAGWRAVAVRAAARLLEVEVTCSDPLEHRRRVEGRASEIEGLTPPSWASVMLHHYTSWDRPHLTIDTALTSPGEAIASIISQVK